jgi:hypothetical protein
MRRITLLSTVMLAAIVTLLLHAAPARALNLVSWVASNGTGTTCTRTAPCGTFANAHDATLAGGEINCVDAGNYGPVAILKSISIVCDNTEARITPTTGFGGFSTGTGVIINALSSDIVTLIGLDIDGGGSAQGGAGIFVQSVGTLHLNKVKIRNVVNTGADAAGINFQPSAYAELYVTDSIITDNSGTGSISGGIIISPGGAGSVNASINGVRLENNSTGIIVDGTRSGGTAVNATIVNSVVAGSQGDGVLAQSGTAAAFAFFDHSVASGNFGSGVRAVGGAATARIGDSTVNLNVTGVSTASGGTAQSFKNNRISGNLTDGTPLPAVSLQ